MKELNQAHFIRLFAAQPAPRHAPCGFAVAVQGAPYPLQLPHQTARHGRGRAALALPLAAWCHPFPLPWPWLWRPHDPGQQCSCNPSTLVPILLAPASAYAPFRRRGRARSRPLPATHWSTGSLAGTALQQLTQRQRMCRYHRLVAELLVPLELYARLRTHTATPTNEANGAG